MHTTRTHTHKHTHTHTHTHIYIYMNGRESTPSIALDLRFRFKLWPARSPGIRVWRFVQGLLNSQSLAILWPDCICPAEHGSRLVPNMPLNPYNRKRPCVISCLEGGNYIYIYIYIYIYTEKVLCVYLFLHKSHNSFFFRLVPLWGQDAKI